MGPLVVLVQQRKPLIDPTTELVSPLQKHENQGDLRVS